MTDEEFAKELIRRLDDLIQDPAAREAVERIIAYRDTKVPALCSHATIQVGPGGEVGMLGILNGICGVKPDGWGYVVAHFEENGGPLIRFSDGAGVHKEE